MNPALTYRPAYLGLFAALLLSVVCNSYLDIQYGSFGFEVLLWAGLFAWTLAVGWHQHGVAEESGKQQQKIVLILGFVVSIIFILPTWGFPRAGLYMLALLQASQNCVTTTRRHLHFGLLVSLVMVMFAASHYRADWTMLFYLVPYVIAVVFTLVAEQVSRRADQLRQASLGQTTRAGQGVAIATATGFILLLGLLLYLLTPQVTWSSLSWRYGQLSNQGLVGQLDANGRPGQSSGQGQGAGAGSSGAGQGGGGSAGPADREISGRDWPTPEQMRQAAKRPGMPAWQAAAMQKMADASEAVGQVLQPLSDALAAAWQDFKEWLEKHRTAAWLSLFGLILAALLIMLYFLLREVRAVAWLRTRIDFLWLGLFARHASGATGARQYYLAMERLLAIHGKPRRPAQNTREYLSEAMHFRDHLRADALALNQRFEQARYGALAPDAAALAAMRRHYRRIFAALG